MQSLTDISSVELIKPFKRATVEPKRADSKKISLIHPYRLEMISLSSEKFDCEMISLIYDYSIDLIRFIIVIILCHIKLFINVKKKIQKKV